jgi:hypothetical protein
MGSESYFLEEHLTKIITSSLKREKNLATIAVRTTGVTMS